LDLEVEGVVGVGWSQKDWENRAIARWKEWCGSGHVRALGEAEGLVRRALIAFEGAEGIGLFAGGIGGAVGKGVLVEAVMGGDEMGLEPGAVMEGVAAGGANTRRVGEVLGCRAAMVMANEVSGEGSGVGGMVGAEMAVVGSKDDGVRAVGSRGG